MFQCRIVKVHKERPQGYQIATVNFQNFLLTRKLKLRAISLIANWSLLLLVHLSIFPPRGGGGDTLGIRQQNNPNPWELDRTPNITNMMAHPRDFGHKVFANGWGISQQFFKIVPWESRHPPLVVNIDRCIAQYMY